MIKQFIMVGGRKKVGIDDFGHLNLYNRGISDISEIEGLDKLTNLQALWLSENQIKEIKGLNKLKSLQALWLSGNQIKEITGLNKLKNLQLLYLGGNQITEIKGLNKLSSLQELELGGNRIRSRIFRECGGLNSYGMAREPQKFVEYCQPANIENRKQKKKEIEYRRLIAVYPCEICAKEVKNHKCPDCRLTVCKNCWDKTAATCKPCKKKHEILVAPSSSVQQQSQVSENDRLFRLKNALQMSKTIPLQILADSLSFDSSKDLSSWLFSLGIVGLSIDYSSNMLKMVDEGALDMLKSLNA